MYAWLVNHCDNVTQDFFEFHGIVTNREKVIKNVCISFIVCVLHYLCTNWALGSVIFRTTRSCLLYDLIVLKITDPSAQYCYLCDASYNFTLVEIDQYGSTNDISALNNSEMEKAFEDGSMSLPQPEHLPGCGLPQLPFYLVGDEIFALKPWLLRPYPGKNIKEEESIFNYRLSRARRVIENCLGILVARWRVFCRAIQAKIETVQAIVQTAICLHNYLRQTDTASYCPAGFVDQSMIPEIFSSRVAQNPCS